MYGQYCLISNQVLWLFYRLPAVVFHAFLVNTPSFSASAYATQGYTCKSAVRSHTMEANLVILSYNYLSSSFIWCVASGPSFIRLLYLLWCDITVNFHSSALLRNYDFHFVAALEKPCKFSLFSFLLIRKSADICHIQWLYICFQYCWSSDRWDEFGF